MVIRTLGIDTPEPTRYNPKSSLNQLGDRYRKQFAREGKKWLPEENDQLLELHLVAGLHNVYNVSEAYPTMCSSLRRRERSVESQFWKIIRGYAPHDGYVCGSGRTDRSGTEFTFKDDDIMILCMSPQARKNNTAHHTAMLLARQPEETLQWMVDEAEGYHHPPRQKGEGLYAYCLRRIVTDRACKYPRRSYKTVLKQREWSGSPR